MLATDTRDEMCWRKLRDVDGGLGVFVTNIYQHLKDILNMSVRNQNSKGVTNIGKLSPSTLGYMDVGDYILVTIVVC